MLNKKFVCRFVGAVALSFAGALGASAQITSDAIPAEYPPESYTANQYIDSQGCAFIRAGLSGNTTWVPRVSRERNQLCGFQPTFTSAPAPDPIPDDVPIIVPVATPAPAPEPAPVPAPVAAPRPAQNLGAPIATVAGLTTPPRLAAPAPVAAPTPAVVPMPAAVPAPVAAAVVAPPPAATITRAEACQGRFGIQTGFISDRTGQPIDCGPRPTSQPVTVAANIDAPQILAPAPATMPASFATNPPRVVLANDPYPGVRRATLAEICAEVASNGARFVNAATGQPIVCAPTVVMAAVQPPLAPTGPAVVGGPAAPGLTAPVMTTASIRTGPQLQSPSGTTSPLLGQPRAVARTPSAIEEILAPSPVPASNPIRAQVQHIRPPAGYERVWDDGRINLNRGVPQPVSGQVVQARELSRAPVAVQQPPAAQPVVRATAPAPQAVPSHRYIQVGTYGDPANADAAAARLRSLGLSVGFANATRNGQQLRVVAAGPFASAAQLNAALQAVRSAGYGDAFPRN